MQVTIGNNIERGWQGGRLMEILSSIKKEKKSVTRGIETWKMGSGRDGPGFYSISGFSSISGVYSVSVLTYLNDLCWEFLQILFHTGHTESFCVEETAVLQKKEKFLGY